MTEESDSTKKIINRQLENLMGEEEKTYTPYRPRTYSSEDDYSGYEDYYSKKPEPKTSWFKKEDQQEDSIPAWKKSQSKSNELLKEKAEGIVASILADRSKLYNVVRQTPAYVLQEVLEILLDYYE